MLVGQEMGGNWTPGEADVVAPGTWSKFQPLFYFVYALQKKTTGPSKKHVTSAYFLERFFHARLQKVSLMNMRSLRHAEHAYQNSVAGPYIQVAPYYELSLIHI